MSYLNATNSPVDVRVHAKYNPEAVTQYNIVPGLMGVVLTMTMVMITALAMTRERERGTMENLLSMPARQRPTAVLAYSDRIALGAVQAARDIGLDVPADLSVVGFDDLYWADLLRRPVTTIAQPMRELGETAARLLLQRLANPLANVPGVLLQRGRRG